MTPPPNLPRFKPMTITQVIAELREVLERHGDLPVVYDDRSMATEPEIFVGLHRSGNRVWLSGKRVNL